MSREQISKRTNRYLFLYLYLTFTHCFKRNRTHKATRYRSKYKYNLHDYHELSPFHAKSTSVCSEEKIQVIVWPHNQCFTKLAARGLCAREFHFPGVVLFHLISIKLYIIRYKSSCYSFLSFCMAHAFHVNDTDTNFKSLTAPVPQGSWRQAQHSTLGYVLWHLWFSFITNKSFAFY